MNKKTRLNSPLVLDLESYYDNATDYTLSKITLAEYVHDERANIYLTGVLDLFDMKYYSAGDSQQDQIKLLKALKFDKRVAVAHNGKFDFSMIKQQWGMMPRVCACTQLMAQHVLGSPSKYPKYRNIEGGTNSLKNLSKLFSLEQGDKIDGSLELMDGRRDLTMVSRETELLMLEYLEQDVRLCAELFGLLYKLVPKCQFYTIDWAIRQFADPVLELESNVFEHIAASVQSDLDTMAMDLGVSLKDLRSVGKFSQLLIDAGMNKDDLPVKVTDKGNKIFAFAKSDPPFQKMMVDHQGTRVGDLCEARVNAQSSILRTRAESYLKVAKVTTKWPVDIIPSGAHTHRPTGASGGGGNPLNLPRGSELRKGIKAPDGYYLLYFDYSAIELRITRWISCDDSSIETIKSGEDVYKTLAAVIFQEAYEDVTDHQRWVGKQLQLALQYGVGHDAMWERLKSAGVLEYELTDVMNMVKVFRNNAHYQVPRAWATFNEVINAWARGRQNLGFYNKMQDRLNLPGVINQYGIEWPSGRRLLYPNVKTNNGEITYCLRGPHYERKKLYGAKLLENVAQSLANEIIDEKQRRIEKELNFRVAMQVYDAIVMAVPNKIKPKDAAAQVRAIACEPVDWWEDQPPLDIEMAAGRTYHECK